MIMKKSLTEKFSVLLCTFGWNNAELILTLLYSDAWVLEKKNDRKMNAVKIYLFIYMPSLRKKSGVSLADRTRNEEIHKKNVKNDLWWKSER